jgi:hypothetical protein
LAQQVLEMSDAVNASFAARSDMETILPPHTSPLLNLHQPVTGDEPAIRRRLPGSQSDVLRVSSARPTEAAAGAP